MVAPRPVCRICQGEIRALNRLRRYCLVCYPIADEWRKVFPPPRVTRAYRPEDRRTSPG